MVEAFDVEIIEQFTRGKRRDNDYSEDRLIIGKHLFGVIDGARGPDYTDTDMITAALENAVCLAKSTRPETTPHILVDQLTENMATAKTTAGLSNRRYTGGHMISVFHAPSGTLWRVGDCPFRMNGITYDNEFEVETIAARQRAVTIEAMILNGHRIEDLLGDPGYLDSFSPYFHSLLDFANRDTHPLGFGVINGLRVPDNLVQVFDIPKTVSELIITSDGYPVVADTLADTEVALEGLLKRDPLCIREHICSKGLTHDQVSFDDRTYLKLRLSPVG